MDRPAKITCVLAGPLGRQPAHLDALCERIMARRAKTVMESSNGHRHAYKIRGRGEEIDEGAQGMLPIPFKRITSPCGLRVPCVSNPIYAEAECDTVSYYTSAFQTSRATQLHESERTKISMGGGRFKSVRLPIRTQVITRVVWFAVLRNPLSRLRKILKQATHLGKKTSQGFGRVAEWIVEPIEDDYSWFAESPDGPVLMRTLPQSIDLPEGCIGYRKTFGGSVGPYWDRKFWGEVWEPC